MNKHELLQVGVYQLKHQDDAVDVKPCDEEGILQSFLLVQEEKVVEAPTQDYGSTNDAETVKQDFIWSSHNSVGIWLAIFPYHLFLDEGRNIVEDMLK